MVWQRVTGEQWVAESREGCGWQDANAHYNRLKISLLWNDPLCRVKTRGADSEIYLMVQAVALDGIHGAVMGSAPDLMCHGARLDANRERADLCILLN
jgi:hypothetical protein